jgi:class 3 adenylate cyclase/predicted ATPase
MAQINPSSNRVTAWLDSVGFAQYADTFERNAITWELLRELGGKDLRELGVHPLGHRKQLLRAIANLRAPDSSSLFVPEPKIMASERIRGERRQLTLMFCDLVDSVGLSLRYDPEDLSEILSKYQSCCEHVVRQFAGYVAAFTGDGLKAYFGYPHARECDPERAVRAGMAIVSAVRELRPYPGLVLSTRVGIATGDVVVGQVIGLAETHEQAVAGETPNLADRLYRVGEPNSVVVAHATKQLIGKLFEYADLGQHHLKGFPKPVQIWRVLRERPAESRFHATRLEAELTPLWGRDGELALLEQRWLRAQAGDGQSVLLSGEAGLGKSRLILELQHRLVGTSFKALCCHGSPYHQKSAFHPIITELAREAGLTEDEEPAAKLDKLENLLSRINLNEPQIIQVLASLLSIATEGRYPPLNLSPQQRKRRILDTLEAGLTSLAAQTPLVLIFEDLHWIDPSTLELLDQFMARIPNLAVLLIMTYRPDFVPTWEHFLNVTSVVLRRLSRRDSELLVEGLLQSSTLSPTVLKEILDRADGVPLFLEELTKATLEAEQERGSTSGRYCNKIDLLSEVRVPRTLHDSLVERLDRLGAWKRIAQTGAVIGRSFTYRLLAALHPREEAMLPSALADLMRAELIVGRGEPPDSTYTFKHALMQDAASASLLRSERSAIHGQIAAILEQRFPEVVKTEPELLALHNARAGSIEPAIRFWKKAAEHAIERSANVEAVDHFRQAIALLEKLPRSEERDRQELDFLTRLGATLTTIKGFAAPDVAATYDRAKVLARKSQDAAQRFSVLRGLWVFYLVRAEWREASDLAHEMFTLARREGSPAYELEGHRALGMTFLWQGEFTRARDHLQRGRHIYDPQQHHAHAFCYGNDPGIACTVHEAFVSWVLGYPDQAVDKSSEAISLARRLGHPFSLVQALIYSSFVHQCRREPRAITDLAKEARALAVEHGFQFWMAEADIINGWARAAQGEKCDGMVQLRTGFHDFLATGAMMDKPRWLTLLAEAQLGNNQSQEGLDSVSEALAVIGQTGECFFEARLRQLAGELILQNKNIAASVARAETCFQEALDVAGRQQAKSWELRAATSLARIWREQARRGEAYDLLAPIYEWFTEGFDTADLKEAKSLLDELS